MSRSNSATARVALGKLCAAAMCGLTLVACKPTDRGPELQVVGESLRLRSSDAVPRKSPWFDGEKVSLVGARGEVLGVQVLHRAGGVTLSIDGVEVRGFNVHRHRVARGSTRMFGGGRGTGEYPDGLVAAAAPESDPAFFDVVIPRDAAVGAHAGKLVVGGKEYAVALDVKAIEMPRLDVRPLVWAYEDPRELGWAGFGEATVGAPSEAEKKCIAMFREHGVLLSPDLAPETWAVRKELVGDAPFIPALVPADPKTIGDAVKQWIAQTQGTGQVPFAIPIDEPRAFDKKREVRALADAARAAGAGPGRFLYAVTDDFNDIYGDAVDLYITLNAKLADTRPRWTYNGAPPKAGSMVLDAHPPGPRTWGWIGYRYNIPVWYVWDALYWHDRHNRGRGSKQQPLPGRKLDPSTSAVSFDDGEDHGNFDGVLALPGDAQTPCLPTLRLAALRRGLQDRKLLELAAKCDARKAQAIAERLVPRALGDAEHKTIGSWPRDEEPWEIARRELLDLAACNVR